MSTTSPTSIIFPFVNIETPLNLILKLNFNSREMLVLMLYFIDSFELLKLLCIQEKYIFPKFFFILYCFFSSNTYHIFSRIHKKKRAKRKTILPGSYIKEQF